MCLVAADSLDDGEDARSDPKATPPARDFDLSQSANRKKRPTRRTKERRTLTFMRCSACGAVIPTHAFRCSLCGVRTGS
jgi:hypothetical protein